MASKILDILESSESEKLAKDIDKTIENIDPNMSVEEFGDAVGKILYDAFGPHNYEAFDRAMKKARK